VGDESSGLGTMKKLDLQTINIDGAARGNPGPAAYAFVIRSEGQPLIEEAGYLGNATNNFAEYTALVKALERARELGGQRLIIESDSELLVKQMNGEYRVKNDQLRVLHEQARRLCQQFAQVTIRHVARSKNSHADRLCNEALDAVGEGLPSTQGRERQRRSGRPDARMEATREDALQCLEAAAKAWSLGNPRNPEPQAVWEQLWSILEENKIVRPRSP
jgi:ribonuclease HI